MPSSICGKFQETTASGGWKSGACEKWIRDPGLDLTPGREAEGGTTKHWIVCVCIITMT